MAFLVFPTQNDINGSEPAGKGRIGDEENWAGHARITKIIQGFEVTVNGVDATSLDIAPGVAIINGFRVVSDAVINTGPLTGTSVHYRVWIQLNKVANLVDGVIMRYDVADPPTVYSNGIVIAEVEKQANGNFRNLHDRRSATPDVCAGTYEQNNNPNNYIVTGWEPTLVLRYNGVDITWDLGPHNPWGFVASSGSEFIAYRKPD